MIETSLHFTNLLYALILWTMVPHTTQKFEPTADLDILIQAAQYEEAEKAIQQKLKAGQINNITARLYEFKTLYLDAYPDPLDRFADKVVRTDAKPQELIAYIFGLNDRGRTQSSKKVYDRAHKLMQEDRLMTEYDSCACFYNTVYTECVYHLTGVREEYYNIPIDSISYYCPNEQLQIFFEDFLGSTLFTFSYKYVFKHMLSKDYLFSQNTSY